MKKTTKTINYIMHQGGPLCSTIFKQHHGGFIIITISRYTIIKQKLRCVHLNLIIIPWVTFAKPVMWWESQFTTHADIGSNRLLPQGVLVKRWNKMRSPLQLLACALSVMLRGLRNCGPLMTVMLRMDQNKRLTRFLLQNEALLTLMQLLNFVELTSPFNLSICQIIYRTFWESRLLQDNLIWWVEDA